MALSFSINTFAGILGRQALGRSTLLYASRLGPPHPHHEDTVAQRRQAWVWTGLFRSGLLPSPSLWPWEQRPFQIQVSAHPTWGFKR